MTTITAERAALAKVGRVLIDREEWGSQFNYTTARTVVEPASRAFVHITVTNPSNYSSDFAHARAVEAIGMSRFPSTGGSYNRMHFQSGRAMELQPIGRRGAHTVNDYRRSPCSTSGCPTRGGSLTAPDWNLNYNSRAYVICQNVGHAVTDAELHSVAKSIAADMLAGFLTRTAGIHGHRDVASKSCPGDRMWARMGELRSLVTHYVNKGFTTTPPPEEDVTTPGDIVGQDLDGSPMSMAQLAYRINHFLGGAAAAAPIYDKLAALSTKVGAIPTTHPAHPPYPAIDYEAIADAIIAKLPASETIDQATVERGVRAALGSLDNETAPKA